MTEDNRPKSGRLKRGLFILAGTFFLVLGGVGIVLPILPTTPFLLLAAACYYKGSERMHRWMLNNRWFGGYIRNYKEGRGISLRAKVLTLSLLWVVMGYSALFMVNLILVQMALLIIAVGVSIHVLTRPTLKRG
jgi:uncharacterized membrane protein YbaN (DUF454 family)